MATLNRMLSALDDIDRDSMKENEAEFVDDMVASVEEWGGATNRLTDNQVNWIYSLWEKYVNN